jgi:hypothetical protein
VNRRVAYHAEAFADAAKAFSWYEAQRAGRGWEFEAALSDMLNLLLPMPEAVPVVHRGLRRALIRRFPYAIYYLLNRRHP